MIKSNGRKILRNSLMVILVINFIALITVLTNLIENNPLKKYEIALVVSFIVIATVAGQICKNCNEEKETE